MYYTNFDLQIFNIIIKFANIKYSIQQQQSTIILLLIWGWFVWLERCEWVSILELDWLNLTLKRPSYLKLYLTLSGPRPLWSPARVSSLTGPAPHCRHLRVSTGRMAWSWSGCGFCFVSAQCGDCGDCGVEEEGETPTTPGGYSGWGWTLLVPCVAWCGVVWCGVVWGPRGLRENWEESSGGEGLVLVSTLQLPHHTSLYFHLTSVTPPLPPPSSIPEHTTFNKPVKFWMNFVILSKLP